MFKRFIQRKKTPKSRPKNFEKKFFKEVSGGLRINEKLLKIGEDILKKKLDALYIYVSDNSSYIIVGKINTQGEIYKTQDRKSKIESCIDKLIKKLYAQASSEKKIEKAGNKLYKLFFPNKLSFDNIEHVWVDCKLKEINPYWEWLHSEKSFWGDRFIINRINTENFKDFKPEKLDISNGTVIQDTNIFCIANKDGKCVETLLDTVKQIRIDNSKDDDLIADCIHFGLRRSAFEESIKDALLRCNNDISSKLLFLNICKSRISGTQDILSDIMTKSGANVCIYTSLDVPESEEEYFVKYFYDNFKNGAKNVAEAVKESRRNFKKDNAPLQPFWRLSYAIFGNPFIELKFRR